MTKSLFKSSRVDSVFVPLQKVKKTILDQMIAEGKKEQLKSFEQVKLKFYRLKKSEVHLYLNNKFSLKLALVFATSIC